MRYLATLLLLLLIGCAPATPVFKTTQIGSVEWGRDITLTAHTGKPVSTADFNGNVVLVFFGYTHCTDICPTTLAKLSAVRKSLGEDAARVQVLFVTVDPARDTPARLAAFLPAFDPSFIGLTGSSNEIAAVAQEYKVAYQPPEHAGKSGHLPHSGNVWVRGTNAKLRLLFRDDTSAADMTHDIKLLLDEV